MDRRQLAAWAHGEATTLLPQLQLEVGGSRIALRFDAARAVIRPGAGGLPTLYLTIDAHAAWFAQTLAQLVYRDTTFADRLGWRDVVVLPASEPTRELTSYPTASISSPRSTTSIRIAPGAHPYETTDFYSPSEDGQSGGWRPSQLRSNALADMLARGTGHLPVVAATLLAAIVLGALHALEPGHGKTLLAASLVGARATIGQAAILAAALTVAHTLGVLCLGVGINLLKGYFVPEAIYPWITLSSGMVIALIGARSLRRQVEDYVSRRPAHAHAHAHAKTDPAGPRHTHTHDGSSHTHAHDMPGSAPLTFKGTLWAAMSGGIAPCPAALVVLFAAVALNEVAYGIFVIVAFSFGLAATLTGLGIAVVHGALWLQNRPSVERFVRYGPGFSALVISTIGAVMVGEGFAARGIATPLFVSVTVAVAILGYAISHTFGHQHAESA